MTAAPRATPLAPRLDQRLDLSGLPGLIAWWGSELTAMTAAGSASTPPWRLLLLRRGDGYDVFVRPARGIGRRQRPQTSRPDAGAGGIERFGILTASSEGSPTLLDLRRRLGRRPIPAAEIVLRLPPGDVVSSQIGVPVAARDVLEPVLRNQIERIAPWPASRALMTYAIAGRSADQATLLVDIAVTSRSAVDGHIAALGALGLGPGVVDFGADPAPDPQVNFLPAPPPRQPTRALYAGLGAILALAVGIGGLGVWQLGQGWAERDRLASRLETLRARTRSVDQLRTGQPERLRLERGLARIAAEKRARTSVAVVLEALSRALPDDVWLDQLEVGQDVVRLSGGATTAAGIIAHLEKSGHFRDVQFTAATTRTDQQRHERFTITAQIIAGQTLAGPPLGQRPGEAR